MSTKALKQQLIAAIAMVLVAAIALGSSTYAWFVNNTKVTAEATDFTASTAYTLMISAGKDATTENTRTHATGWVTTHPMETTSIAFKPVSTIGSTSGAAMSFVYDTAWATDNTGEGADGKHYAKTFGGADTGAGVAANASANKGYLKEEFQIKASQACDLYLDSDTVIKVLQSDGQTEGSGNINKVVRMALTVTGTSGNKTFIYQMDGDTGNGTATTKLNTSIDHASTANGVQYAINSSGAAAQITGDNLSSSKVKQLATASAAGNTTLLTTLNSADKLYSFAGADEICTVTAYVWMEGSDYDCNAAETTNFLKEGERLHAVLSFAAASAGYTEAP